MSKNRLIWKYLGYNIIEQNNQADKEVTMAQIHFTQSRINTLTLPSNFTIQNIEIGIPVLNDEAKRVGLKQVGDTILPSGLLGNACYKNAYGYEYSDKTQPKERRYICTNWIQPYGNDYASPIAVDVYKKCYPKVEVPPTEIEFTLYENDNGRQFILAVLNDAIRENYLKETVNLFLEIFQSCYIFDGEINIDNTFIRHRCNWEILPPGEKPSAHLKNQLRKTGEPTNTFDVSRLEFVERYPVDYSVEGINGFHGYYAYIFTNCCVLESAFYGNATYIIPKENWETLSQKTKKELFDENSVIEKIIHTKSWRYNLSRSLKKLNIF